MYGIIIFDIRYVKDRKYDSFFVLENDPKYKPVMEEFIEAVFAEVKD